MWISLDRTYSSGMITGDYGWGEQDLDSLLESLEKQSFESEVVAKAKSQLLEEFESKGKARVTLIHPEFPQVEWKPVAVLTLKTTI